MLNIFIIFFIISIIIFLLLYKNNENFIKCDKLPSGPYITKCTDIDFKNNQLYAFCPKNYDNKLYPNVLDLNKCKSNIDCNGINVNSDGKLIC